MQENPYAPPVEVRRAPASAEAQVMYTAHRVRARLLRAVAVLHLLFALYLIAMGITELVRGVASWRSSTGDLREYARPDLVAANYRRHAFEAFAIGFGGFSLGALNVAIGIGLWRFRPWPAHGDTGLSARCPGFAFWRVHYLLVGRILVLSGITLVRPSHRVTLDLRSIEEKLHGVLAGLSRCPGRSQGRLEVEPRATATHRALLLCSPVTWFEFGLPSSA